MGTVNEIVREAIVAYPRIFSNRFEVLHHVLAVIGNGYEWDETKGDIYNVWRDEREFYVPRTREEISAEIYQHSTPRPEVIHIFEETIDKLLETENELQAIMDEVDTRMFDMSIPEDFSAYPQSGYGFIMCIPDNATDDWREACEEMKPILIQYGWKF